MFFCEQVGTRLHFVSTVTLLLLHSCFQVNITRSSSESTQLTLNAGKGDCVLHMVSNIPEENFILRLPSYDKILTPVNGAYFLILMVLVFGGTWACCAPLSPC